MATCGAGLSVEETVMLENALVSLELSNKDLRNPTFWGKVYGESNDYLIVVAQSTTEDDYPNRDFFFCTHQNITLKPLGTSSGHADVAENTKLSGDVMKELVGEDTQGAEPIPAYTEKHHLAFLVSEIDNHTSVVPKGAFVVSPTHTIIGNSNFMGLSNSEAMDLENYYHFRKPEKTLRERNGMISETEFLDSILTTHPKGGWSLQVNPTRSTVTIRSLLFPGYSFSHDIATNKFSGVYFGNGVRNADIAFML